MKYTLRNYQQDCVNAIIDHIRRCTDSCVVDCPTGSGKSMIVAEVANIIHSMSGKRILCIAPSKELVEQNYSKYLLTGNPASMYSASAGRKELKHKVVFGSPLTVANNLNKFGDFAAVIIDEGHNITPTLIKIIDHLRGNNKNLRVIALSATCYRMNTGYIYACHYERGFLSEEETINPYFDKLVFSIDARMLIDEGYLTPPVIGTTSEHYDTSGLVLNRTGNWDAKTVDRAFVGQGRKTAAIIADVVEKSRDKQGVMIFAATIKHAQECLESLPREISAIVTGDTKKDERERIISAFKEKRIKYLVNVAVLTTGFDAPHVDHIAILRATESAGLYQQCLGRGLRISEGKTHCLISDYAENIERHFPGDDVFDPEIKTRKKGQSEPINVQCPLCFHENSFTARPNPDDYELTKDGYFADLAGNVIEYEGQKLPSHFGRRCTGHEIVSGSIERCAFKWSFKACPDCEAENDIAARFCSSCRAEIVDPNEKLKIEAAKLAADPYRTIVEDVESMSMQRWVSRNGKPDSLRVNFTTESGKTISSFYNPDSNSHWLREKFYQFSMGVFKDIAPDIDSVLDMIQDAKTPKQIAYRKNKGTKFYDVISIEYAE